MHILFIVFFFYIFFIEKIYILYFKFFYKINYLRVSGKKLFKGKDYNEVIKLNRDCLINFEYCNKIASEGFYQNRYI